MRYLDQVEVAALSFKAVIDDVEALLALEPEELAGYLLEYVLREGSGIAHRVSCHNLCLQVEREYAEEYRHRIARAIREAWSYLEREILVAPDPGQPGDWSFVTRRGRRLPTRREYESFRFAAAYPKGTLHPLLVERTYGLFLRGDYETAVFQAFKTVEIRVREAARLGKDLIGVKLMRTAFRPEGGPLSDPAEPVAEQEALLSLFAGAIGRFKNPASHRHVPIEAPSEVVEVLQFASHLLRIVDERSAEEAAGDPKAR